MCESSRDAIATALEGLKKFQRKWEGVTVDRKTKIVGGRKCPENYLTTHARSKSIAARLFINEFAPLASLIAEKIGISTFADVPQEPPCPVEVLGHGRAALALTGTHDTREAGRRILAWGAMANSPARWHRAENFYIAVAKWAESLVYDTSPGKAWRLLHKPIRWVLEFVERSTQSSGTDVKRRPAYGRDHFFLRRKKGGAKPKEIQSEWNAKSDEERRAICPRWSEKLSGKKGTEVVENAIKKAEREERHQ
jgi:hypothetical protein